MSDDDKFAKDVQKNYDKTDVKAALERETADGPGFEDESELDKYEQLPAEGPAEPEDPMEALK